MGEQRFNGVISEQSCWKVSVLTAPWYRTVLLWCNICSWFLLVKFIDATLKKDGVFSVIIR